MKIFEVEDDNYMFFDQDLEIIKLPKSINQNDNVLKEYYNEKEKADSSVIGQDIIEKDIGKDNKKVISIDLTDGCNLNCIYCFVEAPEKQIFLLDEESLIKNLKYNIQGDEEKIGLYFSGSGEPLINFQLLSKVPDICKKLGIKVDSYELNTNGTLINDKISKFFKEHNFVVNVSMDSFELQHNKTRPYKDGSCSYLDAKRGLETLLRDDINVAAKIVITPDSLTSKISLIAFEKMEVPYVFDIAGSSMADEFSPKIKGLDVFEAQFEDYMDYLIKQIELNKQIYSIKIKNDLKKLHVRKLKHYGCNACRTSLYIDKKGILYPCVYLSEGRETSIGSVMEGIDFSQIKKLNLYAKHVKEYKDCNDCYIRYLCGGGCFALRWIENKNTDKMSQYMCRYFKIYWYNIIKLYIRTFPKLTDQSNKNYIK